MLSEHTRSSGHTNIDDANSRTLDTDTELCAENCMGELRRRNASTSSLVRNKTHQRLRDVLPLYEAEITGWNRSRVSRTEYERTANVHNSDVWCDQFRNDPASWIHEHRRLGE